MGLAVNASTLGMAVAGLAMAFVSHRIDRRLGILLSLCLLAIPTCLLAFAPNLAVFATLRVIQGVFMATAFSLTLAYLGERYSEDDAAGAFAAYITGNVASNLVGRFIAAEVVNAAGLVANFYVFAVLNLLGAVLVYFTVDKVPRMKPEGGAEPPPDGGLARAPAQSCAEGRLRHRLLHPLRLHRHLHLRQLRPDAPAAGGRHDADRLHLSRVSAVDHHDPARGPGRAALRHAK